MKRFVAGSRLTGKVALCAVLAAIALLVVARDGRPARAVTTQIVVARGVADPDPHNPTSIICTSPPVPITLVIAYPANDTIRLCVWVMNVSDPEGAGGFDVDLRYNSTRMSVDNMAPQSQWLGSTGRAVGCTGSVHPDWEPPTGRAIGSCSAIAVPPPFGPGGTGLLAKVRILPGSTLGFNALDFASGSKLVDAGRILNGQVISPSVIPTSVVSVGLNIVHCADATGPQGVPDGRVDFANDILGFAFRYQMHSNNPNWNALFDLNDDSVVDFTNDILGSAYQYGLSCQH